MLRVGLRAFAVDKTRNVVKLTNGSVDYVVYINTEGYLETLYFGKPMRDFDPTSMRTAPQHHDETHVYDLATGTERWFADGFKQKLLRWNSVRTPVAINAAHR